MHVVDKVIDVLTSCLWGVSIFKTWKATPCFYDMVLTFFGRTINLLTHASRAIWDLFCSSFSSLLFALTLRVRANNYGKKMTLKINLILHSEACVNKFIVRQKTHQHQMLEIIETDHRNTALLFILKIKTPQNILIKHRLLCQRNALCLLRVVNFIKGR